MNRCPSVRSPDWIPPASNGTTLPSNRQRMRFSGRTQRKVVEPERIDFGQGKLAMIAGTASATISAGAAAGGASRRGKGGGEPPVGLGQLGLGQAGLAQEPLQRLLRRVGAWALQLLLAV